MIRAIVTDIEGTTSDIRFVHEVLFPYAREHLVEFIHRHQHEESVIRVLDSLRQEIEQPQADAEQLIHVLFGFMDEDRKSTALKELQGMIWRDGFIQGKFTGHLYPDVKPALQRWKEQGIALYVYSSGSVSAQRLLFGYSDEGDVTPLFSGYFDTRVGAKREVGAYQQIASQTGWPASELLFLSDIHQELDAAKQAGWQTIQLIRGPSDEMSVHHQVASFDHIYLEQYD